MDVCAQQPDDGLEACSLAQTLAPPQLTCLAHGFYAVFAGLLLMLVLLFCQSFIELIRGVRIPAYVVGASLIFWGLLLLRKTGNISRLWSRRLRWAMLLTVLSVYFAPFVVWWRCMPWTSFLVINMLTFLLVVTSMLIVANMLAAELFLICREHGKRMESGFFAATVVIVMLLPLLFGFSSALLASIRYETVLAEEIWMTLARVPVWLYACLTAPCALTMVALWKAASFCAHGARATTPIAP